MTQPIRRELCAVMVFAVIEQRGTVVMKDGEELDSWSVILNGQVEIVHPEGSAEFLQMGDRYWGGEHIKLLELWIYDKIMSKSCFQTINYFHWFV